MKVEEISLFFLLNFYFRTFTRNILEEQFREFVYAKYMVILILSGSDEISKKDFENQITEIFNLFFQFEILNVNIFIREGNKIFIYTYYPFSRNSCRKPHTVLYNIYADKKFLHNIPLYPDKLEDFQNCSIPVAFVRRNETEYVTVEQALIVEVNIEEALINTIAQKLNFKPNFTLPPDLWGIIYQNGTVVGGAFGMLKERQVDLALGHFYQHIGQYMVLDQSFSYYTTWFCFAIPPGRPYTSLEKLIKPFKNDVWLHCALIVLFIAVFKLVFTVLSSKQYPSRFFCNIEIMDFIRILLGLSLIRISPKSLSKLLMLTIVMGILIIRTIYQSSLITFIMSEKGHAPLQTIPEMLEANLKLYVMQEVAVFLDNSQLNRRSEKRRISFKE